MFVIILFAMFCHFLPLKKRVPPLHICPPLIWTPFASYGRTLSVSASATFGTPRTLADIRTEDAKYHGSNLNYKLDERSLAGICDRRSNLACMLLFCVAGARLWKHDACVAWPCHATHMQHTQHTVNTTRNTSTFPVNSQ